MPGLGSECTEGFLSWRRGRRQLGSSCCISCAVGAGGCIDSGIKRTFRALGGRGLTEAKSEWLGSSLLALPCCAGELEQPARHLPLSLFGVTAVWERVMEGKRGQKGQADAQRGGGGLVGATKASTGYTRYSGLVVWLSGGFGGLCYATFL